MATKNRKVETRLDDDTYRLLEQIAEDSETSIYELIQRFIEWAKSCLNTTSTDSPIRM